MTLLVNSTYYDPSKGEMSVAGILYKKIDYKKGDKLGSFFPSAVLESCNYDYELGMQVEVTETPYRDYRGRIVCREA